MRTLSRLSEIDRIVTLAMRLLLRRSGGGSVARVPILMYHSISDELDARVSRYFRTVTTPTMFERHMRFLHDEGYAVVTVSEAISWLRNRGGEKPRSSASAEEPDLKIGGSRRGAVALTFDDGLRDFYTKAFPALQKYGFSATMFLASGYIGKNFITGKACLDVGEITELARYGIEFGSHTMSHPQLKRLSRAKIRDELSGSKAEIESILGAEVGLFSYPYRFPENDRAFVKDLRALLFECSYAGGVTTVIGRAKVNDDLMFMPRLPINDADDQPLFRAKLDGCYDWMHIAQLMYKRLSAA